MDKQDVVDPLEKLRQAAAPEREIGEVSVKVLGLGGGGSNAVNRMIQLGLSGVEFIAANTDRQALASSLAEVKLQLGPRITRGLGAGGDPRAGMAAAMESSREIATALAGADMVFITAGMGGGTGTGAAPIAAEIAKEIGAVVIAVVTMPFTFEMTRRAKNALEGIRKLQPHTNTLITVPNDKLLQIVPQDLSLEVAFRLADDVLRQGVQGIAELVTQPGMINVDFAHVREMMLRGGGAYMAIGLGRGANKASDAIHQALHHPLLELDNTAEASGVLIHFTGGEDLTLFEISEAVTELREAVAPDAELILGASTDSTMTSRAQAILVFTGVGGQPVQAETRAEALEIRDDAVVDHVTQADEDLDLPTFLRRRVQMSSGG